MRQDLARRTTWLAMASLALVWPAVAGCGAGPGAASGAEARGTLEPEPCSGLPVASARCYRLAVPENRANPSRTIALRIVVLPAAGDDRQPDPIFYLAGGPGQAATDVLGDRALMAWALRARRDLILADQRGTGGSNGLSCRFYGPPEDAPSFFDKFLPPEKVRQCRQALAPAADLTQYTTQASVDDLDAIRAAMNLRQINLLGGSYGTRLAMEYVRRSGQHVRSVILESPVTSRTHAPEAFGRFAQRALDGLLAECAATDACARSFPNLAREVRAVFARLQRAPVRARVAHPSGSAPALVTLTREHVGEAIRYMMYSAYGASRVPLYLHLAFAGDFEPIANFLIRWRAHGTFDGLYLSITCAEDVPFVRADAAERDDSTYLGGYRVREQRAACAEWPRGAVGEQQFEPVTADVPVLLTSGELDPVTPPANADELARTLPHSLHVRIPSSGHSPAGLAGLDCLEAIKRDFVDRGGTDGLDTSCIARVKRPGFTTAR